MSGNLMRYVMFGQIPPPKDDAEEARRQEQQRADRERRIIQEAERKALHRAGDQ